MAPRTHRPEPAPAPWPAVLSAPWVTHLTCPTCCTPDALLVFDGVGTVCTECGETTRVLIGDGTEDA
jgi:hypothetical protein